MDTKFEIFNGGPVKYFAIDFSEGPGLYELNGTKGVGKTSVLKGLNLVAGHKVDLTVTEGELSGQVRGFGVMAPIGGKKRPKGKLEVDTIENKKFSLEDLVDPPYDDENARDKHRIKAIIGLRNVVAEQADFFELVGGKENLEKLLPPEKLDTDDPVVLAGRIKDALETKARIEEATAEHEAGHAKGCRDNPDGIDSTRPHNSSELQAAYDKAKEREMDLQNKAQNARDDAERRRLAKESLDRAVAEYQGPKVESAQETLNAAKNATALATAKQTDLEERIAELQRQLAAAKAEVGTCKISEKAADDALKAAQSHEETCRQWQETINSSPVLPPSDADIVAADQALETAKQAMEYGVKVRTLLDNEKRAKEHDKKAAAATARGEQYRALAAQTFDVLTKLVEAPGIRVESVNEHPRLVVMHPKRGKTLFEQLSDGERVRYAIDATLVKLHGPALAPLPQRIFQDLPPADRLEISKFGQSRNIYIVGAQVTDGDLRVRRVEFTDDTETQASGGFVKKTESAK